MFVTIMRIARMVTNFTNKTYSRLRVEALRRASASFAVIRGIRFYFLIGDKYGHLRLS
jgi:hypothetical protein